MTTVKVTSLVCWFRCFSSPPPPPRRFVTLCTCEEQTLKAKTQEREWCENPDLKDAGSVIVSVTSFILLCYSKGVLLCSLNPGQKFSSVLSPWNHFSSHSFFFLTVAYCQSKQPGAETCFTPEVILALGVSHSKEVGHPLNSVVCAIYCGSEIKLLGRGKLSLPTTTEGTGELQSWQQQLRFC